MKVADFEETVNPWSISRMNSGSSDKKKMLGPDDIFMGMNEIAHIASDSGTRVLLVGGVAMQCYGGTRFTADLDFVVDKELPGLAKSGNLSFGGYQTETPGGVPVDVILRDDNFSMVFIKALTEPHKIEGYPVDVVSPEYLVLMKMIAGRKKDDVDLETLLEIGVVDEVKVLRLAHELLGPFAEKVLKNHIEFVEWQKDKKNKQG